MSKLKKIVSVILAVAMLMTVAPVSMFASAADSDTYAPSYTPYDGENPSYTFTDFYVDTSATDDVIRVAGAADKFTTGTTITAATPSGIPDIGTAALANQAYAHEKTDLPDIVVKFVGRDPSQVLTPEAAANKADGSVSSCSIGVGGVTKTTETIDGKTAYVYSWKVTAGGTANDDDNITWRIQYKIGDQTYETYAFQHVESTLRQSGYVLYTRVNKTFEGKTYGCHIFTIQGRNVYSNGFYGDANLKRGYINFTSGAMSGGAYIGCGDEDEGNFSTASNALGKADDDNGTMVKHYIKGTNYGKGSSLTGKDGNRPSAKAYLDIRTEKTVEDINLRQVLISAEGGNHKSLGFHSNWTKTHNEDNARSDWEPTTQPDTFKPKDIVFSDGSSQAMGSGDWGPLTGAGQWLVTRFTGSAMSVGSYNYAVSNDYWHTNKGNVYGMAGMSMVFEVYDTTDLYNVYQGIQKGTGSYTTSLHASKTVNFNKGVNPRSYMYTEETWNSFKAKLYQAGRVLQTPDLTQATVNTATSELIAAYETLTLAYEPTVTVNVNHYILGTTSPVAPRETKTGVPAGASVTAHALASITAYKMPTQIVKTEVVDGTVNPYEITFYYEPATYNVVVETNNDIEGNDGLVDQKTYTGIQYNTDFDVTAIYADMGVKPYYTLEGFYYDAAFTNRVPDSFKMPANRVIMYAKWVTTPLHIYVDPQISGVDPVDLGTVSPDENPEISVPFQKPANDPYVEGYIFTGYYADAELNTALTWPQNFVLGDTDRTVYGRFVDVYEKIVFESNGGTKVEDLTFTPNGDPITAPTPPTKEGYAFAGWYTSNDLTTPVTWDVVMPDATGFVAYAKWTPEIHSISFNLNNNSMTRFDTQSISPRAGYSDTAFPASEIPSKPRRFGYVFDKWMYNDGTGIKEYKFTTYPTKDITLIATWRAVNNSALIAIDAYEKLSGEYKPVYNSETNPDGAKIQVGDTVTFRMSSMTNFYVGSTLFVFMYDKNFFELPSTGTVFKLNGENEYIAGIDATFTEVTDSSLLEARWPEAIAGEMQNYAAMQIAIDPTVTLDNYDVAPMEDGKWLVEFQLKVKDTASGSGKVYMDNAWTRTRTNSMGTMFYGWAENATDPVFDTTNDYVTPNLEIATATVELDETVIPVDTVVNLNAAPGSFASGATMTYSGRAETEIEGYVSPTRDGYELTGWVNAVEGTDYPTWAEGYYAKEGYDSTLTFNATWKAIPQPVTFYTDIENGSVFEQKQIDFETSVVAPDDVPTKKGYVFDGWANENGEVYETLPLVPLGGIDIYATWAPATDTKFTVTAYIRNQNMDADGNLSYSYSIDHVNDYTGTTDSEVQLVATAPANPVEGVTYIAVDEIEATMDNYVFDPDHAENVLPIVKTILPDGSLNINVYFKGKPITVTFDAGDGTFLNGDSQYLSVGSYDEYIIAPTEIPKKYGYDFIEWEGFDPTFTYYEDEGFTAYWEPSLTNIQFMDKDGNQIGELVETSFGSVPAAPEAPAVPGYAFKGWKETAEGTSYTETLPAVSSVNDATTGIAKTYYAHYELADINVIYMVDGAVKYTDTYKMGNAVTIRSAETKTGYTFSGWKLADGSPAADFTMGAEEVVISGTFTADTIGVVFNANGGAFADGAIETTVDTVFDTTINLPTAPTKPGYTFNGWATSANAASGSTSLGTLTATSATYYAIWARANVTYYIDIYVMDTEGNYPAVPETTEAADLVESEVSFDAEAREGFEIVDSTLSGVIPAPVDGAELRLVVKYQRNQWNLITMMDGEEQTTTAYYYEQAVAEPATPVKPGYSFGGWTPAVPATMPNNDVTLVATMNANDYTVTFDYAGGTYAGATSYSKDLTFGTVIAVPISTDDLVYEGFEFSHWEIAGTDTKVEFTDTTPTVPVDGITYEAVYNRRSFDIVYMNRGQIITTISVPFATTIADIKANYAPDSSLNPTLEGNTFTDWNWAAIGETMPARDVTVLAQWNPNTYKITFNEDGGSPVTDIELKYGETITFNEVTTKTGSAFDYWYYDDINTPFQMPSSMPALDALYGADEIELKAKWTVKSYTITFDAKNGTEPIVITGAYEDPITAPTTPVLKGNIFNYWYYNDANTAFEIPEKMPALDELYGTNDIKLTAKWTVKEITITFDANGGNGDATITQLYGSYIANKPLDPTREGYTFNGWLLDGAAYTVPDYMEHEENITVVADWEKNTYTIKLNANGGVSEITEITALYGDPIQAPADPTRVGYDFVHWYYRNTAEAYVFDSTMPALDIKHGINAKTITLTAFWEVQQHTITFDANGGSFSDGKGEYLVTGNYNSVFNTPANPTRDGYKFVEWDTQIPTTIPENDITITAVWSANEYTVSFEENGGSPVDNIVADYDKEIKKPDDPTKKGHTFMYWYEAGSEDTAFVFSKMPLGGTTLYAKWDAIEYTINIDAKGGTKVDGSEIISISQDYGTPVTDPGTPVLEGNTFEGWYIVGTDTEYTFPETMTDENVSIEAKWTVNSYDVIFYAFDGENYTEFDKSSVKFGTSIDAAPSNEPVREHYSFEGWSLTENPAEDAEPIIFDKAGLTVPVDGLKFYPIFKRIPVTLELKASSSARITTENAEDGITGYIYGIKTKTNENKLRNTYLDVTGDGELIITPTKYNLCGTGTKVEVYDNVTATVVETYYIVIFGDLNGDSAIDMIDVSMLLNESSGNTKWSKETFAGAANDDYAYYRVLAADIVSDNRVDSTDYACLKDVTLYAAKITQEVENVADEKLVYTK